jgi:hypothetical protein
MVPLTPFRLRAVRLLLGFEFYELWQATYPSCLQLPG